MLAPQASASKTAVPATLSRAAPEAPATVRAASGRDAAAASPVHAMQARLARELDSFRPRPGFDPVRPLIVAVNIACWWGLISLGAVVVHHWPFR
jgi:hypothetical protein